MNPGRTRILFLASIDGTNVHEWGTLKDTIVKNGNTAYLLQYLHPNEQLGAQSSLIIIKPEQIEMIEG